MAARAVNSKNAKPFWPRVRGRVLLVAVGVTFVLADLWQRIVVIGLVRAFPSRRDTILTKWIRGMAHFALIRLVGGVAGAKIPLPPQIDPHGRTLILMNHQSLLDIPLAMLAIRDGYPTIVTRRTYAHRIPLVSFMLRYCNFPLVDPGNRSDAQLEMLETAARQTTRPMLIFPEGHRSRDGNLRPFRPAGTSAMLETGAWTVHALVVDGFWRCGRLRDFADEIGFVRGRIAAIGPFDFDPDQHDAPTFLQEMHDRMQRALDELRQSDDDH